MTSLQTCRLCKKTNYDTSEKLVKYGVRHSAHLTCALTKWGRPFLDRLSDHQVAQLSYMILQRFGLLDSVRSRVERTSSRKNA